MAKLLINSVDWTEIPVSAYAGQNQSSTEMRIKKSDIKPTSKFEGFEISPKDVVDTETYSFLAGKCWVIAKDGKDHDFYYEELV